MIEFIEFIKDNFVTVLGFIVTYLLTKKNFKDEIIKNKISVNVEIVRMLPYRICKIIDSYIMILNIDKENIEEEEKKTKKEKYQEDLNKEFVDILSNVLCYGSKDAIDIAIKMQTLSYSMNYSKDKKIDYDLLVVYSLLITQIKYDLTSEIISPESWFKLRLTNYSKTRPQIVSSINKIVDELNLNKKFKVEL